MTGTSKRTVRCNPPSRLSFLRNVPLGLTATPARRTRGLPPEGPGPRPRSPGGSATAGPAARPPRGGGGQRGLAAGAGALPLQGELRLLLLVLHDLRDALLRRRALVRGF